MGAFGAAFKKLRSDLGLSQAEAALRLGISRQGTISDWETGRQEPPLREQKRLLARLHEGAPAIAAPSEFQQGYAFALQQVFATLSRLAKEHLEEGAIPAALRETVAQGGRPVTPTVPSPDETLADFDAVQAAEAARAPAPAPAQKRAGGAR